MAEPSERESDLESATWLAERAGLTSRNWQAWIGAEIEIIAAAREEGRREERCAKAAYDEGFALFAIKIRSGE